MIALERLPDIVHFGEWSDYHGMNLENQQWKFSIVEMQN